MSTILPDDTAAQAEIARLRAENAALKAKAAAKNPIRYKVSEKGALSVYGIHSRFPVTLYAQQWATLFAHKAAIEKFAVDNRAKLSVKGE